jgi:hypothetical protein
MSINDQIRTVLDVAYRLELRGKLPVIVKTSSSVHYLGNATTHSNASLIGLACGISCEKVSRAQLTGDCRTFFMLH